MQQQQQRGLPVGLRATALGAHEAAACAVLWAAVRREAAAVSREENQVSP